MSSTAGPDIVDSGLVFYIDTFNTKSIVSGSTNVLNLGTSPISASISARTVTFPNGLGNPIRTADVNQFLSGIDLQPLTNFPEVNFTRSDNFTLSVWASFEEMQNASNSNRGIFARGSFSGFVGINVTKSTTSSAASLGAGTRFSNGVVPYITLKSGITTGSNAEIFNAVLVYKSSSMDGYLNGAYVGTVSFNNVDTTFAAGSPPSYGINAYGGSGGNGGIATMSFYNAMIHNKALNAIEILQNFNAQRSRFGV